MPHADDLTPVHLTHRLLNVLADTGLAAQRQPDGIAIDDTDLRVAITSIWDNPDKPPVGVLRSFGVQVEIRSPSMFAAPVFEYSYGNGFDDDAAATDALRRWVDLDLVVLVEAASGRTERCSVYEISSDGRGEIAAGKWRIYVGPLNYIAGEAGAQPCCQACLVTMSMPALMPLLAEPIAAAVKIVASKSGDGETDADCRRNGEDMPEAIHAIAEAAKAWPSMPGLQMRRQYLYFQPPAATAPCAPSSASEA